MESMALKVNSDDLAGILGQYSSLSDAVVWARSGDYKRPLYISQDFKPIFGAAPEVLLQSAEVFYDFLPFEEDHLVVRQRMMNLGDPIQQKRIYYRIKHPKQGVSYIKDWCNYVVDSYGKSIAVTGVAQLISPEQWHAEQQQQANPVLVDLAAILQDEYQKIHSLTPNNIDPISAVKSKLQVSMAGKSIRLTQREAQSILFLVQGNSAKQTARLMNISPRTVEGYIEAIKEKTDCRTKLELLSVVHESDLLLQVMSAS